MVLVRLAVASELKVKKIRELGLAGDTFHGKMCNQCALYEPDIFRSLGNIDYLLLSGEFSINVEPA